VNVDAFHAVTSNLCSLKQLLSRKEDVIVKKAVAQKTIVSVIAMEENVENRVDVLIVTILRNKTNL
jgi:hypothetical protein